MAWGPMEEAELQDRLKTAVAHLGTQREALALGDLSRALEEAGQGSNLPTACWFLGSITGEARTCDIGKGCETLM